jgi:signal transduction histidine kinase
VATATTDDVAFALQHLCRRAEWQWRVRCELVVGARGSVPRTLADHVYRIVQEGLNNVGRHAHAQVVCLQLSVHRDRVDIVLADDGVGFPFHGQYDLAKLTARNLGPRSMKERIASLKGELVLTTGLSGSQLQITLPLQRYAWPTPARNVAAD